MTSSNRQPPTPKNDPEFLRQLPEWESEYKCSDESLIHYTPEEWKKAKAVFSDHDLRILDEPVMEDWEEPYMRVLAHIATSGGGHILEVGYGMGISARFVQETDISRHIVIEANHEVAEAARVWASRAKIQTEILEGLWQEQVRFISDSSIDGILFDSYPLTEKELYQNHFDFFPAAFRMLKKGGVLTYYSDETQWFTDVHIRRLSQAGFEPQHIRGEVVRVSPPPDCEYWKAQTILAPIIRK